mmetsp:Transcript_13588/g.49413  ORF Transcript_13588/g.49413 Transcript_13588/m.49413 type:complete len:193 (-) Transcript_13588:143-721(-)
MANKVVRVEVTEARSLTPTWNYDGKNLAFKVRIPCLGDKSLTRSAVTTFVHASSQRAVFNDVLEVEVLPEATDIQFMLLQEAASGGGEYVYGGSIALGELEPPKKLGSTGANLQLTAKDQTHHIAVRVVLNLLDAKEARSTAVSEKVEPVDGSKPATGASSGGAKKSPLLLVGILGLLGAGVAVLVGSKKKA